MKTVPSDIQQTLVDAIGNGIFSTLTAIRTLYEDKQMKYSGMGLLLSYRSDGIYCLTANHVISPEARSNPVRTPVKCHYCAHHLQKDVNTRSLMLRRLGFKSPSLDLALLESCLSGSQIANKYRPAYLSYEDLKAAANFDVFTDDILVIAGLPQQFMVDISGIADSSYGVLFHLFTGTQICEDENSSHLYEVQYDSDISPHGLSGSAAWVIRASEHPGKTLDLEYLRKTNSNELRLTASFAGLAVEHKKGSNKLGVVKPGACAKFAKEAEPRMTDLRNPEEDDHIEAELNYLANGRQ